MFILNKKIFTYSSFIFFFILFLGTAFSSSAQFMSDCACTLVNPGWDEYYTCPASCTCGTGCCYNNSTCINVPGYGVRCHYTSFNGGILCNSPACSCTSGCSPVIFYSGTVTEVCGDSGYYCSYQNQTTCTAPGCCKPSCQPWWGGGCSRYGDHSQCPDGNCVQTHNDYCSGNQLADYNNNCISDSLVVTDTCANDCSAGTCACLGCTPDCSATPNIHCCPGVCGAACDSNDDCSDNSCSQPYNDYCDGKQLVEYDSDCIQDTTTVTDSCVNTCQGDCSCTNCSVDCSAPATTTSYCVGECGAECIPNDTDSQACGSGVCSGTQNRTCQSDATWGGWGSCSTNGNSCGNCGTCSDGSCAGEGACSTGPNSPDCPCPADNCVGYDYYDYPDFGDCDVACNCDTGTGAGQPCEFTISINSPTCGFNSTPTAAISCDPTGCGLPLGTCTGYIGCPFTLVNDSIDPEGLGDIATSSWDIYTWGGDPDLPCDYLCNYTPSGLSATGYTVELYVEDQAGASSSTTENFTILQDATADFMCSLTNATGTWQDCDTISATEGVTVFFKDDPSLASFSQPSQGATSITSRTWDKNTQTFAPGGPFGPNETNPSVTVSGGQNIIRLTIDDDDGRSDYQEYNIGVKWRLPQWREVPPS